MRSRAARGLSALALLLPALATAAALSVAAPTPAAAADDPCGPAGNEIACENSKPGSPRTEWDINRSGDASIQGFATEISVNRGSRIDFKIDTDFSDYDIRVYRTGYYGGQGARRIASLEPSATLPQRQPECVTDLETDLYDCGNWKVSASWQVPTTAVSGVYVALLEAANGDSSHITFIVRNDDSRSSVVFQTADPTWQAYNTYGGAYFYGGGSHGRAFKVSYNRPVLTRSGIGGRDFYFANEYPMVRFLEKNGYDVSYIAGVDSDRSGARLLNHKTFLSVGHDEYWSGAQRKNVEAARDAGVNLMFLAGNEVYWRTRYEPSIDGTSTPYRTLASYKETWSSDKVDPSQEWTGTWRDPRFAPTGAGANQPENRLIGTAYMVNFSDLALQVPAADGKLRLWRHTNLGNQAAGATTTLAPHTIGYESNEDIDNGHRPPGLIRQSTTTGAVPEYLHDFGNTVKPGTTTHHVTSYRAPSGALVFSAGTVQWTWGLDSVHDSPYAAEPADPRMQQAQVNLLADMGAQPVTLDPALTRASKSTDTTGPTVTLTSPAAGAAVGNGSKVTLQGTATDAGGVVAGVEVSTDGGSTWHAASGRASWSYTYVQPGLGSTEIRVRAMDDSANIGPVVTRNLAVSCPCSVFGAETPGITSIDAVDDNGAAELGMRFQPMADGFVTGVRFHKGAGNGGTHVGSLWSAAGEQLATAAFQAESASGWQTVTFASPVAVAAGNSYVVSYTAPQGRYSMKSWGFSAAGRDAYPLAVAGGFGAEPAGVYAAPGQFPDRSHENTNYFVDVAFTTQDDSPLLAIERTPAAGATSVPSGASISARFTKPVVAGSVAMSMVDALGNAVPGQVSYDASTRRVSLVPAEPLAAFVRYDVTLSATDTQGNALASNSGWSFTTAKPPGEPGVCPCSLFDETDTPAVAEAADTAAVTLGVRFAPEENGEITGVRFYKGPRNTGTHTGALWTAGGAQLATGVFTGESSNGWQTLVFDQPVSVSKDVEYVASYRTTVGRYSLTPSGFATENLSRPPLRVASDSGAYTYGTGFPSTRSASNYLVDVLFERAEPTLEVTAQEPAPGAVEVSRSTSVRVWFSEPVAATTSLTLSVGGTPVAGTTSLASGGRLLSFEPATRLPADTSVQVDLPEVRSVAGAVLPARSWTFRTNPGDQIGEPQTLFGNRVPEVDSADESAPVELGVAFTPAKNGEITHLRFFKGVGNAGSHVGTLWAADGSRLATAEFTGESPSGWQSAKLASPVRVTAGTTYVVSYLAPQGHYSYTNGFFSGAWRAGDLSAPAAGNGRYLYGAAGGFPTYTWSAANYFVDVSFTADAPVVAVTGRDPLPDSTNVPRGSNIAVDLSAPIAPGASLVAKVGGTAVPGALSLSTDGTRLVLDPAAALPADSTVQVELSGVVSVEGAVLPPSSWSFRTEAAAPTQVVSLFGSALPATAAANDPDPVELGTVFTTAQPGEVTHLRFYKGPGNGGTHVGTLWAADGSVLARVTFTGETATGWQTAALSTPVPIVPGRQYVVSYYAPQGRYAATSGALATPWTSGPLTAPGGANGRYRYGAGGGFPTSSWRSTNYFVDVLVRTSAP